MFAEKVNVLGTDYTIEVLNENDDKYLSDRDGYCDKTSHRIVLAEIRKNNELDDFEVYQKATLRHELVHAFLFESGLHESFTHPKWGHEETMIDWIAVQFPKMVKAMQEAGCL